MKVIDGGKSKRLRPNRIPYPFTPFPLAYIDEWLPILTGNEVKVLLFLTRKTRNFSKVEDRIPRSQIVKGTGVSLAGVKRAIEGLHEKDIISITGPPNISRKYAVKPSHPGPVWRLTSEPPTEQ